MGLDPSADGQDRDRGADEEATAGDIFSQEPGERRDRERGGLGRDGGARVAAVFSAMGGGSVRWFFFSCDEGEGRREVWGLNEVEPS